MPIPIAMKSASARTGSHQTIPCVAAYQAVPPRPTTGVSARKRMFTQSREGFFIGGEFTRVSAIASLAQARPDVVEAVTHP